MVMNQAARPLTLLLLAALGLIGLSANAADISARVDRNPVTLDESFQLLISVDGDVDGEPDLDVLKKDFEILGRSQSSSFQLINGHMSRQSQWSVTLMARSAGELLIPAIPVAGQQSQPIKITVKQSAPATQPDQNADVFLEVSADPEESYLQQQIIYTVRLYRAVNFSSASLSEPEASGVECVIDKLGDDSEFDTQRHGKRYRVIERRYAIFPQQSGTLILKPIVFNGQIIQTTSRFLNSPFMQNTRNKRLRSQALTIHVKAIPSSFHGQAWLPAHHIQLDENWQKNPPTFKVGEAITRTLTLTADGLSAAQLPELDLTLPAGLKSYPDQAAKKDNKKSSGITGIREQKIAIIPAQPGQYTLPEIRLDWWNTRTRRSETLRIPARTIQVSAAASTPASNTPAAAAAPQVNDAAPAVATMLPSATRHDKNYWPWLSLTLGLGWLGTLLLLLRQRTKPAAPGTGRSEQQATDSPSRKAALAALKQACLNHDPAATKEALLTWAKVQFGDDAPMSLAELAARSDGAMRDEIEKLSRELYSQTHSDWQGRPLWQAVQHYSRTPSQRDQPENVALSPLYPR